MSDSPLCQEAQDALNQFVLADVLSHLLRRAHFLAEEAFAVEFSKENITPRQKAALIIIYQQPGLSQTVLAESLYMDRNTISEMIKRLVDANLLNRQVSEKNQRTYELYLTTEGEALLDQVILRDKKIEAALLNKIPQADQATFIRCLKHFVDQP